MGVCDACYIFHHYYKGLRKYSYEKPDYFIDDDAVDGYGNYLDVITNVWLEVQDAKYKNQSGTYFYHIYK